MKCISKSESQSKSKDRFFKRLSASIVIGSLLCGTSCQKKAEQSDSLEANEPPTTPIDIATSPQKAPLNKLPQTQPDGSPIDQVWGFIIKKTPETIDPEKIGRVGQKAQWRSKPSYPFESKLIESSGSKLKGRAYHNSNGTDLTPDFEESLGLEEVEFGAYLTIELLKKPLLGEWEVIDTAKSETSPRKWILKNRYAELPKILAPESADCIKTRQSKPLRYGDATTAVSLGAAKLTGHILAQASSTSPVFSIGTTDLGFTSVQGAQDQGAWKAFNFQWTVVLRKTTIVRNEEGTEVGRKRKDYTVEEMKNKLGLTTISGQ